MIKLIKDGALPHPAKCCSCGYSGNERFYFWFKYKEKWGQVLICTVCMNEASRLDDTEFVDIEEHIKLQAKCARLEKENERLGQATNRFTDGFAGLVSSFYMELQASDEEGSGIEDKADGDSSVSVGTQAAPSLFDEFGSD